MSSKLQLDDYDNDQWLRYLLNANEVKADMVLCAGKTVWCLGALEVSRYLYIYIYPFTFTFTFTFT